MRDIGPQPRSGSAFTRRMRLHQSWYRAAVLDLDCGTGPHPGSERLLGSMLRPADAEHGANFLTPGIFDVAKQRLRENPEKIERFRLLHNLLSSQPMCFNLFAPLVADREFATRLARALWGDGVANVIRVVIEWAPQPAAEYLDDETSFDAFIEYERADGALGFVAVETKLTEPFSPKHYDGPTYRRWLSSGGPWRDGARDQVDAVQHNQLWRNHLLAWAMLQRVGSPYQEGRVVVVRHPFDAPCSHAVAGYRKLLRDTNTFQDLPLDSLVSTWRRAEGNATWLRKFERRYLDLSSSQSNLLERLK